MSAYTTLYVSRDAAIKYIENQVFRLSNQELSDLLDSLIEERLYTSSVSSDNGEDDERLLDK